ncbi:ABC transporter permease subunit [Sporosarcina thermotolerans]|uniref:ABC transporter permease subunit n=1 Tax=Sporosarcina thermotolerans TaxID=633404 RepID=A0AAW9A950_9BACL|nr:nickel transporter permease [Sporosarcina thermotolerans]MDW0116218.1 ABC transporter permease subunit [Sporosarcina thermotolerans]
MKSPIGITLTEKEAKIKPDKGATILRRLLANKMSLFGGIVVLLYILIALFAPVIAPYDPYEVMLQDKLKPPSFEHFMGTDDKGRDVFTRILYGARISLGVGFLSVFIGAFFGIILGLISGYYGKMIDTVIMRFVDVLLAFPGLLLALAIVSALGPNLINVVIAVGIFSIPTFARIVRGSTLDIKKSEYIDAVKVLGAHDSTIIFRHILPNILSPIIVQGTLRLATSILSVAGLSFLGMGAQPPSPEWGAMLSKGRDFIMTAPHLALYPGMAIAIIVLAFNIFGDGLRDVLDPKMKR